MRIDKFFSTFLVIGLAGSAHLGNNLWLSRAHDLQLAREQGYAAGWAESNQEWLGSTSTFFDYHDPDYRLDRTPAMFKKIANPCDRRHWGARYAPPKECWNEKLLPIAKARYPVDIAEP
jgi:hypothetical protein